MYIYNLASHQISYSYLQGLVKGNEKFLLGSYIILLSSIFYKNITLTIAAQCQCVWIEHHIQLINHDPVLQTIH